MVSGKRDQRIVRLLARRATLRGLCFQELFLFNPGPIIFAFRTNEKICQFRNDNSLQRFFLEFSPDIRKFFNRNYNDPMYCCASIIVRD